MSVAHMRIQVPIGGAYRLIDVPMSNCINSGITKMYILTQFNSASLNRHLAKTYLGNGATFGDGFVEVRARGSFPSVSMICQGLTMCHVYHTLRS